MLTLTLRKWFGAERQQAWATSRTAGAQRRPGTDLIFRMKSWPRLPEEGRTADIYRVLSVMSQQPVNRQYLLARCRLAPQQLDELLARLVQEGALEVIDPARFGAAEPRAA